MGATGAAHDALAGAMARGVFPAAAWDVGSSSGSRWRDAAGRLSFDADSPSATLDTPFDLASLTKVIATTTLVMDLVAPGRLGPDDPVAAHVAEWRGADREAVTIADLLEHTSGLPARLVDAPPTGRREFEHEIAAVPLEYPPRSRSIYSDLDFILLGFIVADLGGAQLPDLFGRLVRTWDLDTPAPGRSDVVASRTPHLSFNLPSDLARIAAPTLPLADDRRRGRVLVGEVHDNYAAALGGAAGHAGLFGTAPAAGAFARIVLRAARGERGLPSPFTPSLVRQFTERSSVPGSSRARGWDTMLQTSSCGTRMSPAAFGHVGFTGTSLWIDPARDRYFVLLTNRACGGGSSAEMQQVRRAFHDALGDF